jgi:site-specific DNA-cytosine methylase
MARDGIHSWGGGVAWWCTHSVCVARRTVEVDGIAIAHTAGVDDASGDQDEGEMAGNEQATNHEEVLQKLKDCGYVADAMKVSITRFWPQRRDRFYYIAFKMDTCLAMLTARGIPRFGTVSEETLRAILQKVIQTCTQFLEEASAFDLNEFLLPEGHPYLVLHCAALAPSAEDLVWKGVASSSCNVSSANRKCG